MQIKTAAQYIRMSTDGQDLSPLIQKESIAAYATANDFDVVESYEDQGKSGVHISNRPALRKLLADVAVGVTFTHVLVYDVSRWGRFQDSDAAAYYEYHCRLNGVQVIYVGESFGSEQTSGSVILKSMRRLMAAEYSRDLAVKARAGQGRVISMGFHMGPLPVFGYRRCSVSSDGSRRVLLVNGQLKIALTDRIEWVLGPDAEVQLVRRICDAFARSALQHDQIARLVREEGWRSDTGRPVTASALRTLVQNEALIGNFVWGTKDKTRRVIKPPLPTRQDGSVPRIIDDETWLSIQNRLASDKQKKDEALKASLERQRFHASDNPPRNSYGTCVTALERARTEFRRTIGERCRLAHHAGEFGRALAVVLSASGVPAAFDVRNRVLSFWGVLVRIKLLWRFDDVHWRMDRRNRAAQRVDFVLIARMEALYRPLDYFLLTSHLYQSRFTRTISVKVPRWLRPHWFTTPQSLMARLSELQRTST